MARQSSITRLPKAMREIIARLTDQGRTLDEIVDHLRQLDVGISRSALGRYVKKQSQAADQIRRARQMAEFVAEKLGGESANSVARMNMEFMHTVISKSLLGGEDDTEVRLDPKEAMFLATALEKLAKASKLDVDERLKIREEARKEAMKQAAEIVDTAGREKGLSAAMVSELKAKFLGVPDV